MRPICHRLKWVCFLEAFSHLNVQYSFITERQNSSFFPDQGDKVLLLPLLHLHSAAFTSSGGNITLSSWNTRCSSFPKPDALTDDAKQDSLSLEHNKVALKKTKTMRF